MLKFKLVPCVARSRQTIQSMNQQIIENLKNTLNARSSSYASMAITNDMITGNLTA
jgi:hypothetical protein